MTVTKSPTHGVIGGRPTRLRVLGAARAPSTTTRTRPPLPLRLPLGQGPIQPTRPTTPLGPEARLPTKVRELLMPGPTPTRTGATGRCPVLRVASPLWTEQPTRLSTQAQLPQGVVATPVPIRCPPKVATGTGDPPHLQEFDTVPDRSVVRARAMRQGIREQLLMLQRTILCTHLSVIRERRLTHTVPAASKMLIYVELRHRDVHGDGVRHSAPVPVLPRQEPLIRPA